jgi:hypothetical protein
MKIYKEGGMTSYAPKVIKLNPDTKGVLTKIAKDHIHMDIYGKKGPTGSSMDFAPKLISGVLDLFK